MPGLRRFATHGAAGGVASGTLTGAVRVDVPPINAGGVTDPATGVISGMYDAWGDQVSICDSCRPSHRFQFVDLKGFRADDPRRRLSVCRPDVFLYNRHSLYKMVIRGRHALRNRE